MQHYVHILDFFWMYEVSHAQSGPNVLGLEFEKFFSLGINHGDVSWRHEHTL